MREFGLIGKSLEHSFSAQYFKAKFEKENISDAQYSLYPLASIEEVKELLQNNNLKGLNVTIPYKEAILPFLDEIDPIAQEINAVNTIRINKGYCKGYNTDHIGFQKSIRPFLAKEHNRALILGTGGASKAISYVLRQFDISYFYCSSSQKTAGQVINYSDVDTELVQRFPLIVNCSPLGTFPKVDEIPPIPIEGIGSGHLVYDLIYNPEDSLLLKSSKAQGALICNGLNMLKIQAEESWTIWNS